MAALAKSLKQSKLDVHLFIYSSAADFSKTLDNPTAFGQTAGVKVLDKYCKDYQKYGCSTPFLIAPFTVLCVDIS